MSSRIALSAAGTLVAVCLASADAHAFCRAVSGSPPAGYDPATQGCYAPSSGPDSYELYWKNLCVGYSLQRDASPLRHITLDQATQVTANAFAQWTGAGCTGGAPSIQARDLGPVDCGQVQYSSTQPNQHVIVFRDEGWPYSDSSNTLGLTTITFDATNGEIYDADTELNSHDYNLVTDSPAPFGSYDLASVITHEAGHFLGLAHSADGNAVMYAHYHPGSAMLTSDDVGGICAAYPDGNARVTSAGSLVGATCDPTPRHGFSKACASTDGGAGATGAAAGGTDGGASNASNADAGNASRSAPPAPTSGGHAPGPRPADGAAGATGGAMSVAAAVPATGDDSPANSPANSPASAPASAQQGAPVSTRAAQSTGCSAGASDVDPTGACWWVFALLGACRAPRCRGRNGPSTTRTRNANTVAKRGG
jgi:hypothetical protein